MGLKIRKSKWEKEEGGGKNENERKMLEASYPVPQAATEVMKDIWNREKNSPEAKDRVII